MRQELDELNGQARSVTKERMAAAKLSADAQRDHRRLEAVLEPKIADATAVQAKFNEMKEMWLEKSKEVEGLKKPLVKNGAMLRQVTASPADLQGIRVRRDGGTGGGGVGAVG